MSRAIHFVSGLARALNEAGAPSYQIEEAASVASRRLGIIGQTFVTPTAIFTAFEAGGERTTQLLRVEPGEVDLAKIVALEELIDGLEGENWPTEESQSRLDQILVSGGGYGFGWTTVAFTLVSAQACRLLGGGLVEMGTAGVVGLMTSLLIGMVRRLGGAPRLVEPLAAFIATVFATWVAIDIASQSVHVAVLGGLIILLPGLTLTVAMSEITRGHLVSGTARLTGAVVLFVGIAFGVLLGTRVGEALVGVAPLSVAEPLPEWTLWLALATSPVSFLVLFRARLRGIGSIAPAVIGTYCVARAGASWGGPEVGAFAGALALAIASNLYSRVFRRPASVTLVPGVMTLVPGSVGFSSLSSLIQKDVVSGMELAFNMVLLAVALTAGLLLANGIIAPRRAL